MSPRTSSILALLCLVPAPSIGVILAMHILPGPVGQAVFGVTKTWILVLPLAWTVLADRERPRFSRIQTRGLGVGLVLGLFISAVIVGAYILVGAHWIDVPLMREQVSEIGLGDPRVYFAAAAYWCLINALLEEYVWRWFVFRKCEVLVAPIAAVLLAALFFTLHHAIALIAFVDWRVTLISSTGVFIGGAIWSWCYLRYRCIWPGYASHVIVDVAVFSIGAWILFGQTAG